MKRGARGFAIVACVGLGALAGFTFACGDDTSKDAPQNPAPVDPALLGLEAGSEASTPIVTVVDEAGVKHFEVKQVALAPDFGCAVVSDGSVWCWGDNSYGQLGQPPNNPLDASEPAVGMPMKVGISDVKSIAAGDRSACAVKNDATLWCWGQNDDGELGHPPANDLKCLDAKCNHVPTQVGNLLVTSVTIAGAMGCAVTTTNALYCWGKNNSGQIGRPPVGSPAQSEVPQPVPGIGPTSVVRLGYRTATTCAIDMAKQVWCWGRNVRGTIGHAENTGGDTAAGSTFFNPTPTKIAPLDDAIDLITGETICAVRSNGEVWCWGSNDGNLLVAAAADANQHPTPTKVAGIEGATRVTTGNANCALLGSGQITCWGPGPVASGSATYNGGCITPTEGNAFCRNPAVIPDLLLRSLDANHVSAGGVGMDGFAVTWGNNENGRLGHHPGANGDMDVSGTLANYKPTSVAGLP